jgi:transcriptional regulator with XRE-family HTH domain
MAHGTVHLIETGQRIPHLSTIRRLCEVLDVAPDAIDEFRSAIEEANRGKDAA